MDDGQHIFVVNGEYVFRLPESAERLFEGNLSPEEQRQCVADAMKWQRQVTEELVKLPHSHATELLMLTWAQMLENQLLSIQLEQAKQATPQRKGAESMRAKAERRAEVIRAAYEKAVAMHPSYNFSKIVSCIHAVPEVDVSTRSIVAALKALGITGRSHKAAKRGN